MKSNKSEKLNKKADCWFVTAIGWNIRNHFIISVSIVDHNTRHMRMHMFISVHHQQAYAHMAHNART